MSILCESSRRWQQLSKWMSPYGLSQLWGDVGYCNWVTIRKRRRYDCSVQQLWLSVGATSSGLRAGRSSSPNQPQPVQSWRFQNTYSPSVSWACSLLKPSSVDFRLGYYSWSLLSTFLYSNLNSNSIDNLDKYKPDETPLGYKCTLQE